VAPPVDTLSERTAPGIQRAVSGGDAASIVRLALHPLSGTAPARTASSCSQFTCRLRLERYRTNCSGPPLVIMANNPAFCSPLNGPLGGVGPPQTAAWSAGELNQKPTLKV
jgi:hypothetical protein